jgi:hypothetical protein
LRLDKLIEISMPEVRAQQCLELPSDEAHALSMLVGKARKQTGCPRLSQGEPPHRIGSGFPPRL